MIGLFVVIFGMCGVAFCIFFMSKVLTTHD